jgi:hypothetical protein
MNDARHEIIIRRLFLQLLAVATSRPTTPPPQPPHHYSKNAPEV